MYSFALSAKHGVYILVFCFKLSPCTVNDETDHLPTELCKVVDAAASRLEVNCIHESWWMVGTDLYKL